jgi:MoaA/NifB/PqqE/SkfB family radical SAM enzyme
VGQGLEEAPGETLKPQAGISRKNSAGVLSRKTPAPLVGAEATAYLERRLAFPMAVLNRYPKYFLIETVNTCNARCIMCGIDFDKKTTANMDEALFKRIVDDIGAHSDHVEKVMLYLDGEPLLDKRLAKRVRRMKDAGVRTVNIATNASLLDEARSTALIKAGLDEIYFALDSMKKDVYEAIRVRLSFDQVYENIRAFIRTRDRLNPKLMIRLQMILQDLNRDEEADFRSHWSTLLGPRDQIVVQKVHNWASAVDVMRFGDEDDVNGTPCIALWGTCVIHVNGDVPLCCMDTKTRHRLGNAGEQPIAEIWRGKVVREMKEKHVGGRRAEISLCDGCTLWREEKHVADIDERDRAP